MYDGLFRLDGKSIIVTGAASGVGKEITTMALSLGARVTAFDRDAQGLEQLAQIVPGTGEKLAIVSGSVTSEDDIELVVATALHRFGKLDCLVNNAAVVAPAMLHKMEKSAWDKVLNVDLTGPYLLIQACAKHWIEASAKDEAHQAAVVNITSEAARNGVVGQINYTAAKAGLLGVTISAARELARYGVRVNAVSFGLVETRMAQVILSDPIRKQRALSGVVLGREAKTAEVAAPVCFLLSPAANYITGQILGANGGAYISI